MTTEERIIKPWFCELDDELKPFEQFIGIERLYTTDNKLCFMGIAELWETAAHPTSRRYVNIKFYQNSYGNTD